MKSEMRENLQNLSGSLVEELSGKKNVSLREFLANIERNLIVATLEQTNGDQRKAAEILGLKYTTLHEKVKRYHIYFRKVAI